MAKIKSFGTRLYVSGESVGGVTSIAPAGRKATMIEVTNQSSANNAREFISGVVDGDGISLEGFYDYSDAGQAEIRDNIGGTALIYMLFSDKSGFAFQAIIESSGEQGEIAGAVAFASVLRVNGPVYPVFPTLTVTGTLTSNGVTPVTFPAMTNSSFGDRPIWSSGGINFIGWNLEESGAWVITNGADIWIANQDVILPTLVSSWSPQGTATGTPVLTGS